MAGIDLSSARARRRHPEPPFEVRLGEGKDDDGNAVEDILYIPAVREWPVTAQDILATGRILEALRLAVGEESFALIEAYDLTVGDIEDIFEALSKWSGFQTGRPSSPRPGLGPTLTSS